MVLHRITLPTIMDIGVCANLQTAMMEQASIGGMLDVDASGIERISTPGVQLLLCAIRNVASDSAHVTLASASPVLLQAVEDLGLTSHFQPHLDNGKNAA